MNPVCPYCRMEIDPAEGGSVECPSCGTPHHHDCFAENGGCTVFGCAQAPADEPKLSVRSAELAALQPAAVPAVLQPADASGATDTFSTVGGSAAAIGETGPPSNLPVWGGQGDAFAAAPALDGMRNHSGTTSVPPPPPPPGLGTAPPPPLAGMAFRRAIVPGEDNVPLTAAEAYAGINARKRRSSFILAGLFFGYFGIHNFYAGYHRRGAFQAALSVFWLFMMSNAYGLLIAWLWAIGELFFVRKDADGVQFT